MISILISCSSSAFSGSRRVAPHASDECTMSAPESNADFPHLRHVHSIEQAVSASERQPQNQPRRLSIPSEEKSHHDVSDVDFQYPEGGYGWVVLACCVVFAASTMGWGMGSSGVFQEYYMNQQFVNESTSVISLVSSFLGFFLNATAAVSGRLADRYGPKPVLYAAILIAWVGNFGASWCTKIWQLIICQGVIAGIGGGAAVPLFLSIPPQWFLKRRGLASGISMGGAGMGGAIWSLVNRQLLSAVGYQRTLLIMSFVTAFLCTVSTMLIRLQPNSPEAQVKRGPFIDKRILKRSAFWSLTISITVGTFGYIIPMTFITSYAKTLVPDAKPIMTALPLTIMALCSWVGRAAIGSVSDRIGPLNTYVILWLWSATCQLALWYTAKSYGAVFAFVILWGLVAPGYFTLLPQIVIRVFGPENLASNSGLILFMISIGNIGAGPIGGRIFDATADGSWKWVIVFGGVTQFVGGVTAFWARYKAAPQVFVKA